MNKFVGSIYVLSILPIWATVVILFAITLAAIIIGRDIFEGIPYNVAYSSFLGDAGLIIGVLIAATILHRDGVQIPQWLQNTHLHIMMLLAITAIGVITCLLTLNSRSGQIMDIYHDIVIAPILLYLAITLVPIIFINGTKFEIATTLFFVLLWASLVIFDLKYERINQRVWLQNHGVTFKNF